MSVFYDLASLVLVPSGYKASKVYAQKPLTADGQLTFSRASTATRLTSTGALETVSSNVPRLDYTDSTCPKLLLEPQRTNLFSHSENFTDASWDAINIGSASNGQADPYGGTRAGVFTALNGFNGIVTKAFSTTIGQDYIITLWLKGAASGTINLNHGGINLAPQNVITYTTAWQKYTYTFTADSTTSTLFIGAFFSWDNGETIYVGLPQVELGAYATSYIPTTAAAVTRLADSALKTGIASLIGQSEGTLFADIDLALNGDAAGILGVFGTGTTFIYLFTATATNLLNANCYLSGVEQAAMNYTLPSAGRYKIAFGYKANDFVLYVNGVQRGSDNSGSVPACTDLRIDEVPSYNVLGNSKHRQALLFKTRLTNAQLAELTSL